MGGPLDRDDGPQNIFDEAKDKIRALGWQKEKSMNLDKAIKYTKTELQIYSQSLDMAKVLLERSPEDEFRLNQIEKYEDIVNYNLYILNILNAIKGEY